MSALAPLDQRVITALVAAALAEDGVAQDLTTAALVPPDQRGRAVVLAKAAGVVCGLDFTREAFRQTDPLCGWTAALADGQEVAAGTEVARIEGQLAGILRAERVGLNFLQRLSGVATLTRRCVQAVAGTRTHILDTRKTTPGLRLAERYAVRAGGGMNHRYNLSAAILIKDNHLAAVRAQDLTLGDAVCAALAAAGPGVAVEVEVTTLAELEQALEAGARAVLLDNFTPEALPHAVALARRRGALTEASGGITLETLAAAAASGVDYISLGALTHSAPALDLSLEVVPD